MKDYRPVLYIGGALAAYVFVLKPLLETLGLKDTAEEKAADRLQSQTEQSSVAQDYWRPGYFQQGAGKYTVALINQSRTDALVKKLWDAQGSFNDDEEAIFAVFRELKAKSQVSWLAYNFNRKHSKDLYTWLRDSVLNSSELNTVLTITNKLPTGFTKK